MPGAYYQDDPYGAQAQEMSPKAKAILAMIGTLGTYGLYVRARRGAALRRVLKAGAKFVPRGKRELALASVQHPAYRASARRALKWGR
jgi:hypothetical protein